MSDVQIQTKTLKQVLETLEKHAPTSTAENWDPVGLLVGDPEWATPGALIAIDLNQEALRIAQDKGYRLIITHHPCLFHGLSRLHPSTHNIPKAVAIQALNAGIGVIACHTNFDQSALEVVASVSKGLALTPMGRLHENSPDSPSPLLKLAVFVPRDHLESVRQALCESGAGKIGNYDFCSFAGGGEGSFRGGPNTQPFLGKPNKIEKVQEFRLETVFPRGLKDRVLKALFESHPYEEVAYDLYSLEQAAPSRGLNSGLGYGFWGDFFESKPFPELLRDVTRLFHTENCRVTESALLKKDAEQAKVKRVAFAAGQGSSFLKAALNEKCDVMITGEMGYHLALDGSGQGMTVVELGHRESEFFFLSTLKEWLSSVGLETTLYNEKSQKIWLDKNGTNILGKGGEK